MKTRKQIEEQIEVNELMKEANLNEARRWNEYFMEGVHSYDEAKYYQDNITRAEERIKQLNLENEVLRWVLRDDENE